MFTIEQLGIHKILSFIQKNINFKNFAYVHVGRHSNPITSPEAITFLLNNLQFVIYTYYCLVYPQIASEC